MDVASVTLDEVLKAAQLRAASLVPETSGYLALAIADASARLPFRIEDDMVNLSTEGTVKVLRGTDVVQPEVSAALMRDMLDRLLGCSIGSMPGLVSASQAREDRETVLDVIGDLENALVPVNRSAARRALARLARETVRARERGKLDRPVRGRVRSARAAAPAASSASVATAPSPAPRAAAPAPTVAAPIVAPPAPIVAAPAPIVAAPEAPAAAQPVVAPVALAVAQSVVVAPAPLPAIGVAPDVEVDVVFTDPPTPVELVEACAPLEPTPTILASTVDDALVDLRLDELPARAATSPLAASPSPAPAPLDTRAASPSVPVVAGRSPAASPVAERRRPRRKIDDDMPKSTVDQLLASFTVSALEVPGDIEIRTPAPPSVKKAAPASAAAAAPSRRASLPPATETAPAPAPEVALPLGAIAVAAPTRFGARQIALLAVALLVAGLLGHFAPRMF